MAFRPDYGETVLTDEERDALTDAARELLGDPIRKADLYDLEQLIQNEVADDYVARVVRGDLTASDLLTDHLVREVHGRLYAPVWAWGGRQRSRVTNIGWTQRCGCTCRCDPTRRHPGGARRNARRALTQP